MAFFAAWDRCRCSDGACAHRMSESPPSRDIRPWIYGSLDLVFTVLYVVLATVVAPSRAMSGQFLQWLLVLSGLAMAVGALSRTKWGWWVSAVGCSVLLLCEVVLLVLILLSASYLAGVYGSFGLAASSLALVVAALSIELVALLPAFQLKYLMTIDGRNAYGR